MIREFKFTFDELQVKPADLNELLGFVGEVPEPFPEMIERALHEAPALFEIRGGYRVFSTVTVDREKESIILADQHFSVSKIVSTQLRKAENAALFACSAGEAITRHSKSVSAEDPVLGYVFDVLGSVTVEKAMDRVQHNLADEMQEQGLNVSDRYSPGYCNWPVSDQQKLFSLLPGDFCGIRLSDSSLMFPIKSVSGIIGIGSELKQKGYLCNWCNDAHCIFRRLKNKS